MQKFKFFEHLLNCFSSNAKFNSGCGWPAFSQSIENDKNILRLHDTSFGMERTEVRCREVIFIINNKILKCLAAKQNFFFFF